MPILSKCPVCNTRLAFPEVTPADPVSCPDCKSRFKLEGHSLAHLSFTDYYHLLEVSPGASDEEVRKAIRAKILEHHPDRNPDDPEATEKLRKIVQAKELLTEPDKRRVYNSVFYAKELPRWGEAPRHASYYRRERTTESTGPQVDYRDLTRQARMRSRQTSREDIDHLVEEIEVIFMQAGVPINLSDRGRSLDYSVIRARWQWIGTISLGLVGFIFGILNGKLAGALVLSILGGILGWILTSYPGGLVVLAYFAARIFVFNFIFAIICVKIATDAWNIPIIKVLTGVYSSTTLIGCLALGLWGIGMSTFHKRDPYFVHYLVHRQAAFGAWLGSLWAFLILYAMSLKNPVLLTGAFWWIILLTLYLIVDVHVFGRSWVLIRTRR